VDLKGLIHRELGEGLTETELATAARLIRSLAAAAKT